MTAVERPEADARPPSVERLLAAARSRLGERGHEAVVALAREVIAGERAHLRSGSPRRTVSDLVDELVGRVALLERIDPERVGRVINATGVILHTNLGRAPWAEAAIQAATEAARGYSFLELDPATGRRSRRAPAVVEHLVALTGAEDALVTTNNAAAVALAVGLAHRAGVVVSRGELVEIGGGVRIPEIVRRSGARLVEVGTTNRTRASDFEEPLADGRARLVLRVHPSNFAMAGFVEEPDPVEVAALAHRYGAIVVDDLGSGALVDTARYGLAHEPMPAERLAAGADLVTFSGDKLLGGPQAGLIVGRKDLVASLRRDPLARATRADKVVLAALEATLALYRAGRIDDIPVWRMIATPPAALRARAESVVRSLDAAAGDGDRHRRSFEARVVALDSTVGGGSLPGEILASVGVALSVRSPDASVAGLRAARPPILARVSEGEVLLDLRTVDPTEDAALVHALVTALATPIART